MHVRSQIRQRFVSALEASLPSDYTVLASKHFARNATGTTLVDVKFVGERLVYDTMDNTQVRTAEFAVRVQRQGAEYDMDDQLDADEVRVLESLLTADWSDLLEGSDPPELTEVSSGGDSSAEQVIGVYAFRFVAVYRTSPDNPEQVRN
jgi:hypothetical protein